MTLGIYKKLQKKVIPKLPQDRFEKAVLAIKDGKVKVEDIKRYDLTAEQLQSLKELVC